MNRIVIKTAQIVSAVFSPLIMPVYGLAIAMLFSELRVIPPDYKIKLLATVFVLTCLLPFMLIIGLKSVGMVKSIDLTERRERIIPFSVTLVLYAITAGYFILARAPWWLTAFLLGGLAALVIDMIVNRRWKISAHATGVGALTAMVFIMSMRSPVPWAMLPILTTVILAAGLTGTARLILQRHTPAQIYAGFACGILAVSILTLI